MLSPKFIPWIWNHFNIITQCVVHYCIHWLQIQGMILTLCILPCTYMCQKKCVIILFILIITYYYHNHFFWIIWVIIYGPLYFALHLYVAHDPKKIFNYLKVIIISLSLLTVINDSYYHIITYYYYYFYYLIT